MVTAIASDPVSAERADKFEQIFRDHSAMVYRIAYGVTHSCEDAQDILQSIFLRLWRHEIPPNFRQNPRAYLYRAAVNLFLDTIRPQKRRRLDVGGYSLADSLRSPSVDDNRKNEELERLLYEALAELPPDTAQIVLLRYMHGLSDAQMAKMLGASRTASAVRLLRARLKQLIRASLGDKG